MAQAQLSQAAVVRPVCALNEEHADPFSHPTSWLWDFFILTDLFGSACMDKETDSNQTCSTMSGREGAWLAQSLELRLLISGLQVQTPCCV